MRRIGLMLVSYWALFWFINGIDKFIHRTDLMFFTWHGKDRHEQFVGYFSNMNISIDWVSPVLIGAGILEIAVAAVLVYGLWQSKKGWLWSEIGSYLGGAVFIGFCVFDMVAGDRAELLEHSTYLILLAVTLFVIDQSKTNSKQALIQS